MAETQKERLGGLSSNHHFSGAIFAKLRGGIGLGWFLPGHQGYQETTRIYYIFGLVILDGRYIL